MAYAAVLQARDMASKEMDTLRAAIKLSEERKQAKAEAEAEATDKENRTAKAT